MSPPVRHFPRFDRAERVVHWCNATLFLVLLATGASLRYQSLSTFVANRHTVKTIHVYSGLLLAVPLVLGLVLPAGRQLRRDVSRINRWDGADREWWSRRTRANAQLGKFNPGQKLNAVFIAASIVLMLTTGSIMRWFEPFPDNIRTGATFVHDWTFIALLVVIVGHVIFALSDFDSLRGMVRGWVPETWAQREHPAWWEEVVAARAAVSADGKSADAGSDVEAGVDDGLGETRVGAGEMPVGE